MRAGDYVAVFQEGFGAVTCGVGQLPPPQDGKAVQQVGFVAVPHKVTRQFRAVGQIDAPNVDDPRGGSHHLKTVSTSTHGM